MRFGLGGGSRWARGGVSFGRGGVRCGVGSGPFSISGGTSGGRSRGRSQAGGDGEWLEGAFHVAKFAGKVVLDATLPADPQSRSPDSVESKFAAFCGLIDRDKGWRRLSKQVRSPLSIAYRKSSALRKASARSILRFALTAHVALVIVSAVVASQGSESIVGPTKEEEILGLMWFQPFVVITVLSAIYAYGLYYKKRRFGGPEIVLMAGGSRSQAAISARPNVGGLVAGALVCYGLMVWIIVAQSATNRFAVIWILWSTLMTSLAILRLLSLCRYDSYELLLEAGHHRWVKDSTAVDLLNEDEVSRWESWGELLRDVPRAERHIFSFQDIYLDQRREIRQQRAQQ